MKATKEYCSSILDSPRTGECYLNWWKNPTGKPRVIEVPKVWREYGKQYKVTEFLAPVLDNHCVIKAPSGCRVKYYGDYEVEYYD